MRGEIALAHGVFQQPVKEHLPLKEDKFGEMKRVSSIELVPTKITQGDIQLTQCSITKYDSLQFNSLENYCAEVIKPLVAKFDYKEQPLLIATADSTYYYDADQETLIKESGGIEEALGCGKILVGASYKKASKKLPERIEINVELTADYQKDYEIIPFHKVPATNQAAIEAFMARYISKPFVYQENVVGVELNFNRVFNTPKAVTSLDSVQLELIKLETELNNLEAELNIKALVANGISEAVELKSSGVDWLGDIPKHWAVCRISDIAKKNTTKNDGLIEKNLLSLSYGHIVRKDFNTNVGLLPESFETYQIVKQGDIILRLTDLQNDKKSLRVGLVREKGIITSAYIGLKLNKRVHPAFAYYLLHVYDLCKVFYWYGGGLRSTMRFDEIKVIPFVLPPMEEQISIAEYLDKKTSQIDRMVATINSQLEKLKELRKALANEFITGASHDTCED